MSALMIRPVSPFAVATLAPIPLLALSGLFGSGFVLLALLYMTVLTAVMDQLIATAGPDAAPGSEFPAAEKLSLALAGAHFPLLLIGVAGLSGTTGLGFWEGLGVLVAFGLYFGQVSNSNAHELIHRPDKQLFRLGKWVLISLLYGHHVTAHLKVHHRYVATPEDPNTAELGENFYAFVQRGWAGAFMAGWEIEKSMAKVKGDELPPWRHPYAECVLGAAGITLMVIVLFGFSGLIAYLLLAAYAQLQLLLADYVQHYGLRRRQIDDERYETVAPWHSWNSAHWFSGGLMLNGTRHSEHHTNPARPYPELSLPAETEGPRLPYSLPMMGMIALIPPIWFDLMDRRARAWQKRIDAGDIFRSRPLPPLAAAPGRAGRQGDVTGQVAAKLVAETSDPTVEAENAAVLTVLTETRQTSQEAQGMLRKAGEIAAERAARGATPRKRRPGSEAEAEAAPQKTADAATTAVAPETAKPEAAKPAPAKAERVKAEQAAVAPATAEAEAKAAAETAAAPEAVEGKKPEKKKGARDTPETVQTTAPAKPKPKPEPAEADEAAPAAQAEDAKPEAAESAPAPDAAAAETPPADVVRRRRRAALSSEDDDGIDARSSLLWRDEEAAPEPEEPSALPAPPPIPAKHPGEATTSELKQLLRAAGVEPSPDQDDQAEERKTAGKTADVEDAISGIMAGVRKTERRKRASFPELEPADGDVEAKPKPRAPRTSIGRVLRSGARAARGVAAVLRGAPPPRRD